MEQLANQVANRESLDEKRRRQRHNGYAAEELLDVGALGQQLDRQGVSRREMDEADLFLLRAFLFEEPQQHLQVFAT